MTHRAIAALACALLGALAACGGDSSSSGPAPAEAPGATVDVLLKDDPLPSLVSLRLTFRALELVDADGRSVRLLEEGTRPIDVLELQGVYHHLVRRGIPPGDYAALRVQTCGGELRYAGPDGVLRSVTLRSPSVCEAPIELPLGAAELAAGERLVIELDLHGPAAVLLDGDVPAALDVAGALRVTGVTAGVGAPGGPEAVVPLRRLRGTVTAVDAEAGRFTLHHAPADGGMGLGLLAASTAELLEPGSLEPDALAIGEAYEAEGLLVLGAEDRLLVTRIAPAVAADPFEVRVSGVALHHDPTEQLLYLLLSRDADGVGRRGELVAVDVVDIEEVPVGWAVEATLGWADLRARSIRLRDALLTGEVLSGSGGEDLSLTIAVEAMDALPVELLRAALQPADDEGEDGDEGENGENGESGEADPNGADDPTVEPGFDPPAEVRLELQADDPLLERHPVIAARLRALRPGSRAALSARPDDEEEGLSVRWIDGTP